MLPLITGLMLSIVQLTYIVYVDLDSVALILSTVLIIALGYAVFITKNTMPNDIEHATAMVNSSPSNNKLLPVST